MQGKIKWFNYKKNYGFIVGDDSKEYFIHIKNLNDKKNKLNINDIVSFAISKEDSKGRVQAVNVEPVLTLWMIAKELKKEGLKLHRKIKECHEMDTPCWYVADSEGIPLTQTMDLKQLGAYVGFDIEDN